VTTRIILLLATLALSLGYIYEPSKNSFPEKFVVSGNKIVDTKGNEVVFRGLSAIDPVSQYYVGDEIPWEESYYKKMAEWGANIIRIPIHPASWKAYKSEGFFDVLDQTIRWVAKQKIYVYLDFHSIGFPPNEEYDSGFDGVYHTNSQEIIEFWEAVALRYKNNNTVVFYEIFNEPVFANYEIEKYSRHGIKQDWLQWKDSAETIIQKIREVDKNKPIIVGGINWAYDISYVLKYPIKDKQIVYGSHPYPESSNYKNWDKAFGMVKDKYPVFVTEFGFETSGEKTENKYSAVKSYRKEIISYLNAKNISWTAWCFSHKWTPALLTNKDYNPSEAGKYIQTILR